MKKLFYLLLIAGSLTITFTSCTEEEVKPNSELNGGGASNEPVTKG
jgi:hypothetical protein